MQRSNFNIKLTKKYKRMVFKDDPKTMLQLPQELMTDLKQMAEYNKRSLRDEIIARLIATLENNEQLMQQDTLHQLIFNPKLAVDERPLSR